MTLRRILCIVAAVSAALLPAAAGSASPPTYTNPVTSNFTVAFADPAIIRGQDGYWYAYATADSQTPGGPLVPLQMARSSDLVHWSYLGPVFSSANWPTWVRSTSFFWAPDIRYVDGHYVLYFAATDTNVSSNTFDPEIGVATAPTPAGPWTDSGGPVVTAVPDGSGGYRTVIDPAEFTDSDGQHYLYYGSYSLGVYATRLTADGMHAVGTPRRVAIDNRFEGTYVVRHGGYYYLFASSSNCCAGPVSGYSVFAGRSTSPLGPFTDRDGVSLNQSRVGGTLVVAPNGNKFIGTGHNAIITDLSGQPYLVYHAMDRNHAYAGDVPFGENARGMVLGRLDWIDGWPSVRGGAWTPETAPAPVAAGPVNDAFESGSLSGWSNQNGAWTVADGPAGHYAHTDAPATLLATAPVPPDVQLSADLRGNAALLARDRGPANQVAVSVTGGTLTAEVVANGHRSTATAPLPADFDPGTWHQVDVALRGQTLNASVSDDGLGDPYATLSTRLPASLSAGQVGVAGRGGSADADDVRAAALYAPHTAVAPTPRVGRVTYQDDFTDGLGAGWTWVRQDPAAEVSGGALHWPTEAADLVGGGNNAGVLLRDAPQGDYVVETKLTLPLGTDTVRNYEQAGLVAYDNDNQFLRLCHVAIWDTRDFEYGKEIPQAGSTNYGSMLLGTPATTSWLRLAHTVDPQTGEHLFRAGVSTDGVHWVWGGTWTLPAGTTPRIGLVSHGGNNPPVTADFDYVRIYQP